MAPSVMSADERTAMMAAGPATGATRRINGRHGVATAAPAHYAEDYYDEDPGSSNRRTALIVAGVLVVLGLVGFLAYQLLSGPAKPVQIAVPPVVGKTQVDATNAIVNSGLRIGSVTKQDSPVAQTGTVISTDPSPGTAIDAKSLVNIVVGTGPAKVNVPPITGMSVADATSTLKAAGLTLGKQSNDPTTDATKVGTVTATTPKGGTDVKGGSAVDVTVGVKQTVVKVPDVTGKSQADAAAALQAAGLQPATQDVDGTQPQGTVVSTTPAGGQNVAPNSTVTMSVSKGNQQPAVPGVAGQSENQAKQTLKQAGFTNVTVQEVQTGQQGDGKALGTNPGEGSQVGTDTEITLYIARGNGNGGNGFFGN
jgi:eukaryotic-like serine/threonine-protein kinase